MSIIGSHSVVQNLFGEIVIVFGIMLASSAPCAARLFIEPPPPLPGPNKPWSEFRQDQVSFAERLKLWGISIDIGRKFDLDGLTIPGTVNIGGGWKSPEEFFITGEFRLPRNPIGMELAGTFKIKNGQAVSGDIKLAVAGSGVSAGGSWSPTKGLDLSRRQASFQYDLTQLKIEIQEGQTSGGIGFKFGDVSIVLDPTKYYARAKQFAPELLAAARERVGNAEDIELQFNAVVLAAATTDQPRLLANYLRHEVQQLRLLRPGESRAAREQLLNRVSVTLGLTKHLRNVVLSGLDRLERESREREMSRKAWRETATALSASLPPQTDAYPAPPPVVARSESEEPSRKPRERERPTRGGTTIRDRNFLPPNFD